MNKVREVGGPEREVVFTGYGGDWMKKAGGFEPTLEMDMDLFFDKMFVTYRKGKTHRESMSFRWNPFNLVNKHYTRRTD